MKPYVIVDKMFPVVGVALLLCLFALSFGSSKIDPNSISEVKGNVARTALTQGKPPDPAHDAASPAEDKIKEEHFPGSRIKAENAVKKAHLIIVGKFVDPGIRSFDSPGKTTHGGAKVEVLQVLKGYVSEELSLSFEVYNDPPYVVEKEPEVGQRYIIFINEKAIITALKFLLYTEEQRWRIVDLVSSAPNGKR